MPHEPKTLAEAIVYFQNPDNCIDYMTIRRWPGGRVACPSCGRTDVSFVPSRRLWQCKTRHPKAQFSIKTGTILEDSPLGLEKWLPVMWMVANCKNGVSSWEIHRALGVTQKTAWFMLHRIRLGMQDETSGKLGGPGNEVEADEAFIGGSMRNMHKKERIKRFGYQRGPVGKAVVMGLLDRGKKKVHAKVLPEARRVLLHGEIRQKVETGTSIYTDEAQWPTER
jgi:transposase-like protein